MSGMKHTPGPWFRAGLIVKQDCGDRFGPQIARVAGPEVAIDPECEANADLIAAAPDMLAALDECKTFLDDLTNPDARASGPAIVASFTNAVALNVKVRSALAKATGRAVLNQEGRGDE
jgi:hypothetical protein